MRKLLLSVICLSSVAFADEGVNRKFEIQLAPTFGYSSYNGASVGLDGIFGYALDQHWQLNAGIGVATSKRYTARDYSIGVNYNFSEDWSRSWFAGAGLGLWDGKRIVADTESGSESEDSLYYYIRGGRRFRLNDSGSITWNPYVQLSAYDRGPAVTTIMPLNFAFSF